MKIENKQQIIKSVNIGMCPHCSKEIIISYRTFSPVIDWILKEKDLDGAKNKLIEEIEKITFKNSSEKKSILESLNKEEIIIGPEEVSLILGKILEDNSMEIAEDKPKIITKNDDIKKPTTK